MKLVIGITLALSVLTGAFFMCCCKVAGHEDALLEQASRKEQEHAE